MNFGALGAGFGGMGRGAGGAASLFGPFELARTQRIDIVGLGDSNQLQGGFGWDHGIQYALKALGLSMWATPLLTQNENNGSGSSQGYGSNRAGALIGAVSGAPTDLDKLLNKGSGSLFPGYYTYLTDGGAVSNSTANGLILSGTPDVLDNGAALEFDFYWGSFDTGSGFFRPSVRVEQSPFNILAGPASINTNTGAIGIQKTTVAITADATRSGKSLGAKYTRVGATGIAGPFFTTYMRARNPARSTGFAYSTLDYRGGQSTRTVAVDLQQATDETLTHYFGILRDDQGGSSKCIVIMLSEGLNDRGETLTSVGPAAVSDGNSPEAFVDNATAIVNRIKAIWTLNSWPQEELHWGFMPSHRIADPDDAELVSYRSAITTYAASLSQAYVIDLAAKITSAQMLANGWYASSGSDKNHLAQAGYEGMGLLAVSG